MTEHVHRLLILLRRMADLRLMRPRLSQIEPELSWPQMGLLRYLAEHSPCHVQDIAEGLGITAPSASVAIRRLEEGGWLLREPDPDDRRAALISLSEKGHAVYTELMKQSLEGSMQFLTGLTSDEQDQLLDLFEKAIDAAEHRREQQPTEQME